MTKPIRKIALASVAVLALASAANAETHKYKFQSSDPAGNPNFELQQNWAKNLAERTDNQIQVEMMPVGSVVEHNETLDATGAGIIDGIVTDISYFAGKDPAFSLLGNPVGAWSSTDQLLDFMNNGGGQKLANDLFEPYDVHYIGSTTTGLEALVSKVPLDGVADLKGLKMRAPEGLVQDVFAAAGAAPVNLPGSEVYTALDKGVIDAADYTVFSTNQAQGLNDIAPNPVYPGFHSMPLVGVAMNKKEWDALSPDLQKAFEESVKEFADKEVSDLAAADKKAVAKAEAGGKIHVHDWSDEERAKFRRIAITQWEKVAKKSEKAQHVYDVLTDYLKKNNLL
ncbi:MULTISPECIES: TRAP transporter substrate-binding protein [Thioclava]|uniref:C4-dicarboxylate ABC transporter substrate-binding protein n=1 Tax=Thioclava nitratireducens TaxID=1915078 RepID=A0ABM6IF70_9RHOB|nr:MULTISPECIES: TRAP transporter substrate-binding protein [Thioclava]AQS47411.1 C4-dicarboxylate ABC transporter substrate-binding protein [Thioclava nitratireducens]OWY04354.1 C4-dicarboxylate ABC transporter substrate-binding protein [Thioclava sp. IC9]OWY05867.1 C4-dicarboxylate ABC transporter substrate-binding protein [Thioclava sp. F1Mire-8]OWY11161.1 C4-dicarboxylate ABC transporter substrate-binding protein [Thioclava sp. F42-5]OWY13766.1 C4-dicarboxylate ABC transporter substrate-bi